MLRGKNRVNKFIKNSIVFFSIVFSIYFIFFSNTISVSAKTIVLPEEYKLVLEERGGLEEEINGVDIGLKYNDNREVPGIFSYDQQRLIEAINKLSCFDTNKIIKTQDAQIKYENNTYIIVNEVYGNSINKDILFDNVAKAIFNGERKLNLESINCYENPKYTASSQILVNAKDTLNKYVNSKVTYNFAGLTQTLDGSTINNWIYVDENFQIILDEVKVKEYVDTLANIYNTSLGKDIKVNGGYNGNNHSWIIDSVAETKLLIDNIKNGQVITKYPVYAQKSIANYFSNVGDTYVEIDMTNQHLWYYKKGYLIAEGDIVTGNVSNGHTTPTGIYNLYYKQRDTVLRGEDYASPVNFWMPFNGGIGLHDASWRSEFGGEIYKTNGSHGCINLPYYVAKSIYDNIDSRCTIICYN